MTDERNLERLIEEALPPYGHIPEEFQAGTNAPDDWMGGNFRAWLDSNRDFLRDHLWPVYDSANKRWSGGAADPTHMLELTALDLQIINDMRPAAPGGRTLDEFPNSPLAHPEPTTHRRFFTVEDTGDVRFGEWHRKYDREMDQSLMTRLPGLFIQGWIRKAPNHITFWFKQQLQRPRPYQAALILYGDNRFSYQYTRTAVHPAMISGHGLVGMMGVAGILESILLNGPVLNPLSWVALQQYAVDIGDRRVMAGVHYPSDNLASWLLVLDLCPHVCRHPGVKTHLWHGIQRSTVYLRMKALVEAGGAGPYEPAWRELHRRAGA